jgi:hypothetical protein
MAANSGFAGFTGHRQAGGDFCAIEGLTSYSITTNNRGFIGNYNLEIGKKYYWEVRAKSFGGTNDQLFIGVCKDDIDLTSNRGGGQVSGGGYGYENYDNGVYLSSTSSSGSGPGQFRSGDLPANIRVKVDRVNHTISWALNSGSFSSTYSIPSTGRLYPWLGSGGGSQTAEARVNFGQDSTFSGDLTAQTNTDENGFGEFYYSVPSGFVACCNGNRSVSANIDPNLTDDDYNLKQMNAVSYTGNSTNDRSITLGFKPDLVITKETGAANNWYWTDSTRGVTKHLNTNSVAAEHTDSGMFVSFDTDGVSLGTSGGSNNNGDTYSIIGFRANGGTTTTNSVGDTNSTVQANTKAGFSIIKYTGTGSNTTIGHGLSTAPDFMIIKNLGTSDNYIVYSRDLGAGNRAQLNNTNAWGSSSTSFNSTDPSSTVISLGTSSGTNSSGGNYICYAWHSVAGYSSFGTYDGSGQEDGRYIDLGFRPRFIFGKKSSEASTTYGWWNFNTAHQTSNKAQFSGGWFDTSAAFSSNYPFAILGNGFKHRNNNTNLDASGKTYFYAAWGDVPAKYNNGF